MRGEVTISDDTRPVLSGDRLRIDRNPAIPAHKTPLARWVL